MNTFFAVFLKSANVNAQCTTFTFTPSERTVAETGGDYTVAVSTTPFNCSWNAYADYSWIEITSGASGSGAGLIHYTVDPNTADRIRQGYISITETETSFLITQEGPGSGYFQNPNTGTDSYGHIYKRYDMLMNWQDAETFCEGRGGYLATITDDSEQSFFRHFYDRRRDRGFSPMLARWIPASCTGRTLSMAGLAMGDRRTMELYSLV